MNICFSFLVCKQHHCDRTLPLYKHIYKFVETEYPCSKCFLFGGFKQFDHIPVIIATEEDDYLSCITKLLNIFRYHSGDKWEWFFIGDDDTFINFTNLEKLTKKLSKDRLAIYGCVDWAPSINGLILHAHGGSGILFNRKTFNKLKRTLEDTNYSIKHHEFSDVTLAMNVYDYNKKHSDDQISFIKIQEMPSPHIDINALNPTKVVTIHTKDRVSLEDLYKQVGR